MAAMAGALGMQLEKVDHYILGEPACDLSDTSRRECRGTDGGKPRPYGPRPQATHLRQAEQMVWRVGVGVIALTAVLSFLVRRDKWTR